MQANRNDDVLDEDTKVSRSAPRRSVNGFHLTADEQIVFKIRITCDDDKLLLRESSASILASLQDETISSFKEHIDQNIFVRVSFHQGSLILIVCITATIPLIINSTAFKLIKNDVKNIAKKTFSKLRNIDVEASVKTIDKAVNIFADVASIVVKLFSIFGGGGFPPVPPSMGQDGWTPV